ncbi:MAG TPA: plastocyanin/azurin family copper-binding protein [Frankiaceae bacterium]|nr:plastocyanin/azurin family copper-binding protein [Frankiaceae bacterium]
MRPALRVLRAAAALIGAASLALPSFSGPAVAADQTVQAGSPANRFAPASVTINVGDTVTWEYAGGSDHTVTSSTANWEKDDTVGPPNVLSLSTSYMFDAPGTYRYICKTHNSVGMRGTVVVRGATRPRPTASRTPTARPTATRTPRPTASVTPTATPTASPSVTPSPSAGTATPGVITAPPESPSATTPVPLPSVARPTPGTPYLGTGGLTPHSPTGRGKGLPVMLALLLVGGIGSAELRALLAHAPSTRR